MTVTGPSYIINYNTYIAALLYIYADYADRYSAYTVIYSLLGYITCKNEVYKYNGIDTASYI